MIHFEKEIEIRWQDCDINRHVRHSAYFDYAAHLRIRFFGEHGYPTTRMEELGVGPILFKEECSFLRELGPDDTITIRLLRGPVREDASRWVLHHVIYNGKGEKAAHLTASGSFIDLKKRKLTVPPADLAKLIHQLPEGEDFVYKKS